MVPGGVRPGPAAGTPRSGRSRGRRHLRPRDGRLARPGQGGDAARRPRPGRARAVAGVRGRGWRRGQPHQRRPVRRGRVAHGVPRAELRRHPRPRSALAACLEALGRDFAAYRAGWYSATYLALAPTDDEASPRQAALRRLLGAAVPGDGGLRPQAARVQKAGRLEARRRSSCCRPPPWSRPRARHWPPSRLARAGAPSTPDAVGQGRAGRARGTRTPTCSARPPRSSPTSVEGDAVLAAAERPHAQRAPGPRAARRGGRHGADADSRAAH